MNGFLTLSLASIKMYLRNRLSLFWALFFPLTIMLIFGVISNSSTGAMKVAIVSPAQKTTLSENVITGIKKLPGLKVESGTKEGELQKLQNNDVDLVLVLLPSSNRSTKKCLPGSTECVPGTQESSTYTMSAYYYQSSSTPQVQAVILELRYLLLQMQSSLAHMQGNIVTIQPIELNQYQLTYSDFLLPGIIALAIMQGGLFGVVATIVTYKEKGILRRLFATPLSKASFVGSQVVTYIFISLFQILILLGVGIAFLHVRVIGSLPLVILLGILGSLIFICIGFAISGRSQKVQTAMPVANVITLPMMFLSGVFFSAAGFPEWVQKISQYLPLTYLSDAIRGVMTKGYNLSNITTDLVGLIVWIGITFVLAVSLYKWE